MSPWANVIISWFHAREKVYCWRCCRHYGSSGELCTVHTEHVDGICRPSTGCTEHSVGSMALVLGELEHAHPTTRGSIRDRRAVVRFCWQRQRQRRLLVRRHAKTIVTRGRDYQEKIPGAGGHCSYGAIPCHLIRETFWSGRV